MKGQVFWIMPVTKNFFGIIRKKRVSRERERKSGLVSCLEMSPNFMGHFNKSNLAFSIKDGLT